MPLLCCRSDIPAAALCGRYNGFGADLSPPRSLDPKDAPVGFCAQACAYLCQLARVRSWTVTGLRTRQAPALGRG
jgi:hypothetical protein